MFRFTIRELLLLTLVVGLSLGWMLRERQLRDFDEWKARAEILKGWVEDNGEEVYWNERGLSVGGRKHGERGAEIWYDGTVINWRRGIAP